MTRIGVTGGRDYGKTAEEISVILMALASLAFSATLVHGAATGADSEAAHWWGERLNNPTESHPADWAKHGKAAGHIRNQEMVDSGLDLLIAFPGGRGTADMVRRAKAAGVPVRDGVTGEPL